jgi:hypothetical protein
VRHAHVKADTIRKILRAIFSFFDEIDEDEMAILSNQIISKMSPRDGKKLEQSDHQQV